MKINSTTGNARLNKMLPTLIATVNAAWNCANCAGTFPPEPDAICAYLKLNGIVARMNKISKIAHPIDSSRAQFLQNNNPTPAAIRNNPPAHGSTP